MERSLQVVETERLIATRISTDDLDDLIKMNSDTKIIKTIGKKKDYKEAIEYTKKRNVHWNEHNFGIWVFRDKETKRFIGKGGLEYVENSNKDVLLDFIVASKYWNHGYGTEIGKLCLEIGLNKLRFEEIICFILNGNLASQRVMEKLGMQYNKDIKSDDNTYIIYTTVNQTELV